MAQDRDHDRMDCKRPSTPLLCANNCGFFGCPATMNLCSKCYENSVLKEQSGLAVKALGEKLQTGPVKEAANEAISRAVLKGDAEEGKTVSISPSLMLISDKEAVPSTAASPVLDVVEIPEPVTTGIQQSSLPSVRPAPERPNTGTVRCLSCRRRLGLLGFKCRCGGLFCSLHRYSDKHECTFDYKAAARDAIAKTNPVVKAEKLQKI